jgi:hypothetical protein
MKLRFIAIMWFWSFVVLILIVGCRGNGWMKPPGPLKQQQANAVVHDPYPQSDLGPNDAASRPPSYANPLPEAVRNRIVKDSMPWVSR